MKHLLTAAVVNAALILAATQAPALSCIPPDPVRTFQMANEAEDSYVVLYGTFGFDESLLPPGVQMGQMPPDPAPIPARFDGHALTLDGFNGPVSRPVIVQPVCGGPWCGGMGANLPYLAFAKVTEAGYVVEVDPCGFGVFQQPDRATLAQMTACLRGDACEPSDPFPRQ